MYAAVHIEGNDAWRANALRQVQSRLDGPDLQGWVIDADDAGPGGPLAASALLNVVPRLTPPGQTRDHRGYCQWVSTDAEFRRRGYAKALMEHLLAHTDAAGFEVIELHSSPFGRQLYLDLGFVPFPAVDYPADVRGVPMIRKHPGL
jgi:GNAT superfamily N-acetyltransferase